MPSRTVKAPRPRRGAADIKKRGEFRIGARAFAVKLSAEHSMHRIGRPEQWLQVVRISANEVGIEAPLAVRRKTPVIESKSELQFRGRAATADTASSEIQFVRRISKLAFHFVPIQLAVTRFGSFYAACKGGSAQRSYESPLPVNMSANYLGFRLHSAYAIDEIIVGGKILGVDRGIERRIIQSQRAAGHDVARLRP